MDGIRESVSDLEDRKRNRALPAHFIASR